MSKVCNIVGGVYWKPARKVLEGPFELLVVNARHIKAVPGRKTDVRDAEWIADLLQHGLLKSSFIPPTAQRELRDLTRHRVSLVEDRARVVNRLQKVLEDTNVKLGDVATDILGKSARAMLDAMLGGQTDPQVLADLARGRLRTKRADLEQALVGVFKPHHRFLLSELLTQIDTLDEAITRVRNEIATRMQDTEPIEQDQTAKQEDLSEQEQDQSYGTSQLTWAQAVNLLCTIPGKSRRTARGDSRRNWSGYGSLSFLQAYSAPSQGCVRATTKVQANGSQARRAKATPGYANCWWKPPMRQLIRRIPICRLSTTV